MKKLFFLFFPMIIFSQEVPIGHWKNYQSYNSASHISESDERIYCVSSEGIYYVNKDDNSINRLSKINGLSDVSVKKSDYDKTTNTLIITYENCNIDLVQENSIINISDIKRKEITGKKTINNIYTKNGIAYLSCSFGLVLLDLINYEVIDTYQIGFENEFVEVKGCVIKSDTIFAASNNKIYYASTYSTELFDYTSWSILPGHTNYNEIQNILASEFVLLIDTGRTTKASYSNNSFVLIHENEIAIYSNDTMSKTILTNINFSKPKYAHIDNQNSIWIADSVNGLLKIEDMQYAGSHNPQGPVSNKIYSLEFYEEKLYVCHGGHSNFGQNLLINEGVSIKNYSDDWRNNDRWFLGNARDILGVAVKNDKEYYASWYHGVSFVDKNTFIKKYGFNNTNGALDTTYYSNNRIRISDLKFDNAGNLWGLSSEVNHPLFVKTTNEEWYSFSMNQGVVDLFFDDLIIDYWGQKWGVIGRGGGVFVYNNNNTIGDSSDDQFNILTTSSGEGKLPSQMTYCIAEDLNNDIWVGTDNGVGVFYNPELVFTGYNFDAEQILIQEGDYGQYLLSEEKVKCIVVDGANRKWIGTEESGVFLLSEDGTREIIHFTEKNSPLPSNNIIDISINDESGEVYIGTLKGLVSYRSNATSASVNQSKTHVFPNPVRENYHGDIAIGGLTLNANIKITNIEGELVYEGVSYGGQAIWNGKDKNNQRVSTGVYLVFSVDPTGKEKAISKIMFIK